MLRKHNKFIMLLLLVTFMFSIVGSAGAATFSDVTGTTTESAAIYKLTSLGIIDGYPDGTFGPEKTITRAEFAKIACITAGLKSVASGMGGTASTFSDVATSHWANGWINVAAAQGFVKGYPDGTYQPEGKITQAEVITVLMRLLGYNDNLPGNWPSDYIAKAANLGVLDDITFVSNQDATRGTVAVLVSATLEENMVEYAASDNLFNAVLPLTTLLADNFESATTKEILVYDIDLSGGTRAIKVIDPAITVAADRLAAVTTGTFKSYELTPDCVIANAANFMGVAYRYVDFVTNDDGDVTYIKVRDDYEVIKNVAPKDIERVSASKIKVNDKTYTVAALTQKYSSSSAGMMLQPKVLSPTVTANIGFLATNPNPTALPAGLFGIDGQKFDKFMYGYGDVTGDPIELDAVDIVLNDDGEVAFVSAAVWPTVVNSSVSTFVNMGVVDEVSTNYAKIYLKGVATIDLDEDDTDSFMVLRNGQPATLADIKAGDFVYELDKYNIKLIVDMALPVSGILNSFETKTITSHTALGATVNTDVLDTINVGDKTYTVAPGGGYLSTDEGDSFAVATPTNAEDILGETVTLSLNPVQEVAAITSGQGTSNKIYGVVEEQVSTLVDGAIKDAIKVYTAGDTEVTYGGDKDSTYNGGATGSLYTGNLFANAPDTALVAGAFVEIVLDSDGVIKDVKVNTGISTTYTATGVALDSDTDNKVVNIGASSYDATDAIIFNTSVATDPSITSVGDFLDAAENYGTLGAGMSLTYKIKDGKIQYLVSNTNALTGSLSNVAMVTSLGIDADGRYAYLMFKGEPVKYYLNSDTNFDGFAKNVVSSYKLVSGEIDNTLFAVPTAWDQAGTAYTVVSVNGSILELSGGKTFYVDSDTLFYDNTGDGAALAELRDVGKDAKIKIYREGDTGALLAIEIVD